jgi:hypothetical protein
MTQPRRGPRPSHRLAGGRESARAQDCSGSWARPGPDENAPVGICFMPVTDQKTVKNRVHLDLTSSAQDRDQEIERLLALGARRADIGQTGAESWTVLADPEGNEFCVVRPKETLTR